MRYADFTIKKRGGTLLINKEMWLQDYPPDVNAKWGPMSPKARRQRTVILIPFLGLMIATVTYLVLDLRSVLGTEPGFLRVFLGVVVVFVVFKVVDAVIIDWLILRVFWPGLGVLPGTEGMPGYRDARLWAQNMFKGFVFVLVSLL